MGRGDNRRSPKMRRLISRRKKKARIGRKIAAAKGGAKSGAPSLKRTRSEGSTTAIRRSTTPDSAT